MGTQDATASILGKLDPTKFKCTECGRYKSLDKKYDIFAIDAALIYESGLDTHLDYVVVITSHLKLRIERVMTRGELTREEFLKRRELQWPDEDKVHMADFVIHNNGTAKVLEEETKKVYNLLL